jgi:hypothetical protein
MPHDLQPTLAPTGDAELDQTRDAEHHLARAIVIGIFVAVPICVALWLGLIALALRGATSDLGGPLILGGGIGVLSGVFFGTWAGFVSTTHTLEELDRRAMQRSARRPEPGAGHTTRDISDA